MIDIHCHILPGIDDGSQSVQMSLDMLELSKKQGVNMMFLTPHFYADDTDPQTFARKRNQSALVLRDRMNEHPNRYPKCILGAEVHYYRGIGRIRGIEPLCMGNSRYILLEPPFHTWNNQFLDDVRQLRDDHDLKVIIAHVERYFDQEKSLLNELLEEPGILFQANAEDFQNTWKRRKLLKLLKEGKVDFLGSDCHNMSSRMPNLPSARTVILDKAGTNALHRIDRNSELLVEEARKKRESL